MKTCFKCNVTRPLSEFYKHPQMTDGHVNKCKGCNKKDVQENYRAKHNKYLAYEAERSKLSHRKDLNRITTVRMRTLFPEKYKAHSAVNYAIRNGVLRRQPCERCGGLRVHAHHEDYNKPLEVMWLCPIHHKERHKELEEIMNETEQISRHINDAPDSLEIGTPAKGGAVKVYGNFNDPESFKAKIDKAKEVREHAQQALAMTA